MTEDLVTIEKLSKKFCRRLKRSLWYGVRDLGSELLGQDNKHDRLRKDEFWAVKNISFCLKRGETLGLIGKNGAGKTTLLRMLNGLIKPDEGRIEVSGRMQALIALGAGFNPVLTGRENIYINAAVLGIPKSEVNKKFDEIIEFSGIEEFIDTPVQNYSSGMAVRLGFAVASNLEPDILLVDEVLAVGDEGFQLKCLNKIGDLKQNGTAIILVSHNMHTISNYARKVILMNNGKHKDFDNVSEGIKAYRRLFFNEDDMEILKVCSGNDFIRFYDVKIENQVFLPGDSFCLSSKIDSKRALDDIEIDITMYSSNEPGLYFQATNKAYDTKIDVDKGTSSIEIQIENIRMNNATGMIGVAIWTKNRGEKIFWWRIPIEFKGMNHSTGKNFLGVRYLLKKN